MDGAEGGDPFRTTTTTITVANTVVEMSDDADLTITVVNTVEEMADDAAPDHIHRLSMNGTDLVEHHIQQYSISEGKAKDQDHLQDL